VQAGVAFGATGLSGASTASGVNTAAVEGAQAVCVSVARKHVSAANTMVVKQNRKIKSARNFGMSRIQLSSHQSSIKVTFIRSLIHKAKFRLWIGSRQKNKFPIW
jgi:hypothetical protein